MVVSPCRTPRGHGPSVWTGPPWRSSPNIRYPGLEPVDLTIRDTRGVTSRLGPLCHDPPGHILEEGSVSLGCRSNPTCATDGRTDPGTSPVTRVKDGVRGLHVGVETECRGETRWGDEG